MRWALRIFGFPVFELHADEPDLSGWGYHTSGQYELGSGDLSAEGGEYEPEFGFRGSQ